MRVLTIFSAGLCFAVALLVSSCDKQEDDIQPIEFNHNAYVVRDFEQYKASADADSVYTMQNQEGFFNNVGRGYDLLNSTCRNYLFSTEPNIHDLISIKVDESLTAKVLVSCNIDLHQHLLDSCIMEHYGEDSLIRPTFSSDLVLGDNDNTVYFSIIYIRQFGYAVMDYNSPEIYKYTTYQSDSSGPRYNDGAFLDKNIFIDIYGNAFVSKIGLGGALVFTSKFFLKDNLVISSEEIISELSELIIKAKDEKIDWDELIKDNNYLLSNNSIGYEGQEISVVSVNINSIDNVFYGIDELNENYNDLDFGLLGRYLLPYSVIFPNYNLEGYK